MAFGDSSHRSTACGNLKRHHSDTLIISDSDSSVSAEALPPARTPAGTFVSGASTSSGSASGRRWSVTHSAKKRAASAARGATRIMLGMSRSGVHAQICPARTLRPASASSRSDERIEAVTSIVDGPSGRGWSAFDTLRTRISQPIAAA